MVFGQNLAQPVKDVVRRLGTSGFHGFHWFRSSKATAAAAPPSPSSAAVTMFHSWRLLMLGRRNSGHGHLLELELGVANVVAAAAPFQQRRRT
jgi:hypothetical protein